MLPEVPAGSTVIRNAHQVGEGTYGVVYKGWNGPRQVALKICWPSITVGKDNEEFLVTEGYKQGRMEVKAMEIVNSHFPALAPKMIDSGDLDVKHLVSDDREIRYGSVTLAIATELAGGTTIAFTVDNGGWRAHVPSSSIRKLHLVELCLKLKQMHSLGISHGDYGLNNVMFRRPDRLAEYVGSEFSSLVVIDWAMHNQGKLFKLEPLIARLDQPPEIASRVRKYGKLDGWAKLEAAPVDVWRLGVEVWYMIFNIPPRDIRTDNPDGRGLDRDRFPELWPLRKDFMEFGTTKRLEYIKHRAQQVMSDDAHPAFKHRKQSVLLTDGLAKFFDGVWEPDPKKRWSARRAHKCLNGLDDNEFEFAPGAPWIAETREMRWQRLEKARAKTWPLANTGKKRIHLKGSSGQSTG